MPPEAIFQVIDSCQRLRLQEALTSILGNGQPNITHYIAANLLKKNGVIWTTNYDTLIEQAAKLSPADSTKIAFDQRIDNSFKDENIRLIKPHGTLPVPDTWAFRSQDVLRQAPFYVKDRLLNDIKKHYMIFLGYSASDLDLRPILQHAIEDVGIGLWFCRRSEKDTVTKLFSAAVRDKRLQIFDEENPSMSFWNWAKENELIDSIPKEIQPSNPRMGSLIPLIDDPEIRSIILRRAGAIEVATYALRPALKRLNFRAIDLYLSINRQQRRTLGLVSHFLRAVYRTAFRALRDKGLYSLSYMAFESGRYRLATRIAQMDLINASPRRKIQLVASLRMDGRFDDGVKVVQEVFAGLKDNMDDANFEARGTFEMAMCLRWSGRELDAKRIIDSLDVNRLKHADLNWQGWIYLEKGTCLSLRGAMADAGANAEKALEIFTVVSNPIGRINTLALQSTVRRFSGQIESAWETIKIAEELLLMNVQSQFTKETIEFEKAELFRYENNHRLAEKSYSALLNSTSELHKCHGRLGMAELERDRKRYEEAQKWGSMAWRGYQKLGCKWGECNAILSLVLCKSLTPKQGEVEANKTGYILPGDMIESIRLGQSFDYRPLNLP
jgi:tetratricopeptide (TPR) repeat protein